MTIIGDGNGRLAPHFTKLIHILKSFMLLLHFGSYKNVVFVVFNATNFWQHRCIHEQ